ncbi:MAG: M1 family metallopeptidase [Saprospiraceae bacterium]|nr:M1 family metallopeptidase [Saprospiraceae bacterium]
MKFKSGYTIVFILMLHSYYILSQNIMNNPSSNHGNKFEQLGSILPDPNTYRNAAGAPGFQYWQMKADYKINVFLDEENFRIKGDEWITFHNLSPESLDYLWLQLDENQHSPDAESNFYDGSKYAPPFYERTLTDMDIRSKLEGHGVKIEAVLDGKGQKLPFTIHQTMMRVDLRQPLASGKTFKFFIKWTYAIPNRLTIGGRGGYELFPEDQNALFTISQWYPRMCVYSDFQGWQNKQFSGRAEFALTFGNFDVKMNVPADHIVASTGECQNYGEVLSADQFLRYKAAIHSDEPIEIVLKKEAEQSEKQQSTDRKIWHYKANNVRDFAFGSSRKFIWDAMGIKIGNKKVMCMSYYPKESYGLYRKYSTKVVAHTIRTYSKYTIDYPYPVAISVEASNGMEYPMICFNFGRTEKDGTYSEGTKYGMIGVIIHEVGHNFFPMIINSDERQWTWMDEGLNSFIQYLTQEEFDNNYPSPRGPAHKIVDYMRLPKDELEPIMTNSDNLVHFGSNAYHKTATALTILRETIMGRELFDHAFKKYAERWKFKHPTPADFFRTMEDASSIDLDWFWRAWFYDIDPVDISMDSVIVYSFVNKAIVKDSTTQNSSLTNRTSMSKSIEPKYEIPKNFKSITKIRNKESGMSFLIDRDTSLRDFYYTYKEVEKPSNEISPGPIRNSNSRTENELLNDSIFAKYESYHLYEIHFSNIGGCVMPIILQWNYKDGTSEIERIHAYIWRKNEYSFTKTFLKKKPVQSIVLDPFLETADIDMDNNIWNTQIEPARFELFKSGQRTGGRRSQNQNRSPNPMQKALQSKEQNK